MVAISFLGMRNENPRPMKQGKARVLCKQSGKPITSPVYRSKQVMVAISMVAVSFLGMHNENPRPN